jgi:hypothetical protein
MTLRLMFLSFLVFSVTILKAQSAREEYETRKDIFLGNNIYVVYTGKAAFDSLLHENFSKFFTIRPIKGFISQKEFEKAIRDNSNSFIYTTTACLNYGLKYPVCGFCILAFNGGRKNTSKYNFLTESAAVSYFDEFLYEKKLEKSGYRLPLIISDLEREINLKHDSTTAPKFNKQKILAVNIELVNGTKKQRGIDVEALAGWPGKYELLSSDKIAELVRNRDERYMLLTPVLAELAGYVQLHDLASMRVIATLHNGKTVFRTPWVRSREIEKLLDIINKN